MINMISLIKYTANRKVNCLYNQMAFIPRDFSRFPRAFSKLPRTFSRSGRCLLKFARGRSIFLRYLLGKFSNSKPRLAAWPATLALVWQFLSRLLLLFSVEEWVSVIFADFSTPPPPTVLSDFLLAAGDAAAAAGEAVAEAGVSGLACWSCCSG